MELPIPRGQLFYADKAMNPQSDEITVHIDYIHYPTLGCPALLGPGDTLQVLLSLPVDTQPSTVSVLLDDRHNDNGETFTPSAAADPEEIATSRNGDRKLWRLVLDVGSVPHRLFDLVARFGDKEERQYNSVRRYDKIEGDETVLFCGDTQFNLHNKECTERFIERVNNQSEEIAWIALIGDVCDNGVKNPRNLVKLAATAHTGTVENYYLEEFWRSHEHLRRLRCPILLMPGNHDGICAYKNYEKGIATDVFTGPDPSNEVAYDGLHYYRRTFGPLYFGFTWNRTRYICANSFELGRHERLGYHAIVANWGGWVREAQAEWIEKELARATAAGQRKVVLMHHDPRGGSEGKRLGRYHRIRRYDLNSTLSILGRYFLYVLKHIPSGRWQQEWMAPRTGGIDEHPVRHLLADLLQHEVFAVIMGHDNENWVDSYYEGQDLFASDPTTLQYNVSPELTVDPKVVEARDLFEAGELDELAQLLEGEEDEDRADDILGAALQQIVEEEQASEIVYSDNPARAWGLTVRSAIHFVHVDDVGAYKHSKEKHFRDYGFVRATLDRGAPEKLQAVDMHGQKKPTILLEEA